MTWITCVVTSGREPRRKPAPAPETHLTDGGAVPVG
jgi:hypothetical protein